MKMKILMALFLMGSSAAFGAEFKAVENSCIDLQTVLKHDGVITIDSGVEVRTYVLNPASCGEKATAFAGYDLSEDNWYCRLGFFCVPK